MDGYSKRDYPQMRSLCLYSGDICFKKPPFCFKGLGHVVTCMQYACGLDISNVVTLLFFVLTHPNIHRHTHTIIYTILLVQSGDPLTMARSFPCLWEAQAASVLDLQKAAEACVSATWLQICVAECLVYI